MARPSLPGTPPIVDRASEILRTYNRHLFGGLVGAAVLTAAMAAVAYQAPAGILHTAALFAAFTAWAPLLFAVGRSAPDDELVRDANAVLKAWGERREAWAKAIVDAAGDGAADEVRAWSEADVELRRLGERARSPTVENR